MSRLTVSAQAPLGTSVLVFAAGAAVTISRCTSMAAMGVVPMPGGWTPSMAWSRMCGQSWAGAAASFLGMWVAMTTAMMLPSLHPMLQRFRQAAGSAGARRPGLLTVLVSVGYFGVWTAFGVVAFPLGVAVTAINMKLPVLAAAAPIATGVVVLAVGGLQFTAWKARRLACCREMPWDCCLTAGAILLFRAAWQHGLRLGFHCSCCCAGLTVILLVLGVMDLRVMALVTMAITAERLAPAGNRVARAIGVIVVGVGLFLIAQAAGFGSLTHSITADG